MKSNLTMLAGKLGFRILRSTSDFSKKPNYDMCILLLREKKPHDTHNNFFAEENNNINNFFGSVESAVVAFSC